MVEGEAGSQLVAVCFAAHEPVALGRFWARALRWEVGEESDRRCVLVPTDGTVFTLAFVPADGDEGGPNRLHLDLTTASPEDQLGSAEELIALGGQHLDIGQGDDAPNLVLADPEGNELCLIEPDNRFLAACPRLGSITCDGSREVGHFWSAALGWPLVWDQDAETAIQAPGGTGPMITWGGPPVAPKAGPNRLHLDVAPRTDDLRAELGRLLSLGATLSESRHRVAGRVAMADPDGNEFCVLSGGWE